MPSGLIQARRVGSSSIGDPVTFIDGEFGGHTLRAELIELQKADLGRKYARKDRRPLDPPPVVQFRLFEVYNAGTPREIEKEFENYDDIKSLGLLCHVDLFPVPGDDDADVPQVESSRLRPEEQYESPSAPSSSTMSTSLLHPSSFPGISAQVNRGFSSMPPSLSSSYTVPPPLPPPSMSHELYPGSAQVSAGTMPNMFPMSTLTPASWTHSYSIPAPPPPPGLNQNTLMPSNVGYMSSSPGSRYLHPSTSFVDSDVVAYYGDYAIAESSSCTEALVGATFVQSASLEYKGKKALMFVFSDLAVKIEGTFILRYRVFNIFSKAYGAQEIPVLAECYGGPFKIYSTKEFPGLRASTDLTKHISFFGVRLNLRENERKRRKKNDLVAEPVHSPVSNSSASPAMAATSRGHKERRHSKSSNSEDGGTGRVFEGG
ncbi:velvet factor-domain-containing protein [Sparassis latifolia]